MLPCLFNNGNEEGGQIAVLTFSEEYECLETLGPVTRRALTEQCYGKWSSYDVLKMMWGRGYNPKDQVCDQRVAGLVLRKDRLMMGGGNG